MWKCIAWATTTCFFPFLDIPFYTCFLRTFRITCLHSFPIIEMLTLCQHFSYPFLSTRTSCNSCPSDVTLSIGVLYTCSFTSTWKNVSTIMQYHISMVMATLIILLWGLTVYLKTLTWSLNFVDHELYMHGVCTILVWPCRLVLVWSWQPREARFMILLTPTWQPVKGSGDGQEQLGPCREKLPWCLIGNVTFEDWCNCANVESCRQRLYEVCPK